jgi:MOSC domain-containing protein YiiM
MKKLLALSIGVATFCPTLALADAQELITAINSGKATVDVRLRSERVSDDSAIKNDAHAETIRTVLSYKTADYQGFTGFLQFEDVTNFGEERYNNTIYR